MKIQIKSLHIVDCGPIKDAVFDFTDEHGVPRETTLMMGANGSGKTTILKVIAALSYSLIHTGPSRFRGRVGVPASYSGDFYHEILSRTRHVRMDWLVDDTPLSLIGGWELRARDTDEAAVRIITASGAISKKDVGSLSTSPKVSG